MVNYAPPREDKQQTEPQKKWQWLRLPQMRFGFRRKGLSPAELAAGATRCAAAAAALIEETEPDFVRLAHDLKELYNCARQLGEVTDRQVTSLRDTIGGTRLIGSGGLAELLLGGLRSSMSEIEAELNWLNGICSALVKLTHLGGRIRLTAIFLNTARCSFRVESARTEATRQSFGPFSEELEPLANQVAAVGDAISRGAQDAYVELSAIARTIRNDAEHLQSVTNDTGRTVEQACRQGQALLDCAFNMLAESGSLAGQRHRHADDAVFHVQFGDIVRQKIEHIVAALDEAAAAVRRSSDGNAMAHADRVLAMQQGQIELIATEIRSVQQGLPAAFAGLAEETEALAACLRKLGQGEGDCRGDIEPGRDIFEELKNRLRRLEELESSGRAMSEQSRASWKRALETSREGARNMDQLREINFRMHLQSLNAIIKTEWLGEQGVTLGVLSSHMHTVFCESSNLVESAEEILKSLAEHTAGSASAGSPSPADRDGELRTGLDAGLLAISRVQRGLEDTVAAAEEMVLRQNSQLEQARKSVLFLDGLARRVEELTAEIAALRENITTVSDGGNATHGLATLERRYTMDSEREVHRRHTAEAAPEPVAATQDSELGDNVDFF